MTAQEIIHSHLAGWEENRSLFLVSREELEVLISELDLKILKFNEPNRDGTYYSEVEFGGKRFCHSGREKVTGAGL